MNIKYDNEKYDVSIIDALRIYYIKTRLTVTRVFRWKRFLGLESIMLLVVLSVAWALCAAGICFIESYTFDTDSSSFLMIAWNLKEEYISTVLIVLIMRLCSKAIDNKNKLKMQHRIYCDLMDSSDRLFEPALGDYVLYYMPFYSHRMLDETLNYINKGVDLFIIDNHFFDIVENIRLELKSVEQYFYQSKLVIRDEQSFIIALKDAIKAIDRIMMKDIIENNGDIVDELSSKIIRLIDHIREYWRRDTEYKAIIVSTLYQNDRDKVLESFYLRMQVCSVEEIIEQVDNYEIC